MESTPLVSIIVPVYNVEKYIDRCVESVVSQTFTDWELLLIDDGSPDKSGELCDVWSKHDSRIKVFHKKNGGVSSARNLGIEISCGKWIIFVDSDDWIDRNCLSACLNIINKYQVDIVQFGYRKVKFSGKIISEHLFSRKYLNSKEYAQIKYKNVCAGGSLIKSDIIINNHIRFKEGVKYAEDQMFIMNCMRFSEKIMYHNNIYYNYHINLQSAVHNAKIEDKIKSCYEIVSFAGDDRFYGRWKDNLLFNFLIDFILNYNIDNICLKSFLKELSLSVNNLYGLKRKLIYLTMLINPFFAVKITHKLLG